MDARFPVPRYIIADQHKSEARFLICKLNPSVTHNSTASTRAGSSPPSQHGARTTRRGVTEVAWGPGKDDSSRILERRDEQGQPLRIVFGRLERPRRDGVRRNLTARGGPGKEGSSLVVLLARGDPRYPRVAVRPHTAVGARPGPL